MFYPGFKYTPPCHWCNTPSPDHTKTCRFRPADPVPAAPRTCDDCGTKVEEHPTWCKRWIDYAKRPEKKT